MGRGRNASGGQSSLGYLFGGGDLPPGPQAVPKNPNVEPPPKESDASPEADNSNKTSQTGASDYTTNNYFRANGQNCGNFITDRPSTKVNSAPGGYSSLNYLFSDGSSKK